MFCFLFISITVFRAKWCDCRGMWLNEISQISLRSPSGPVYRCYQKRTMTDTVYIAIIPDLRLSTLALLNKCYIMVSVQKNKEKHNSSSLLSTDTMKLPFSYNSHTQHWGLNETLICFLLGTVDCPKKVQSEAEHNARRQSKAYPRFNLENRSE